jgi:hypothetical protein
MENLVNLGKIQSRAPAGPCAKPDKTIKPATKQPQMTSTLPRLPALTAG